MLQWSVLLIVNLFGLFKPFTCPHIILQNYFLNKSHLPRNNRILHAWGGEDSSEPSGRGWGITLNPVWSQCLVCFHGSSNSWPGAPLVPSAQGPPLLPLAYVTSYGPWWLVQWGIPSGGSFSLWLGNTECQQPPHQDKACWGRSINPGTGQARTREYQLHSHNGSWHLRASPLSALVIFPSVWFGCWQKHTAQNKGNPNPESG